MDNELKILWICPKWTLPAIDGARVATEKLISNTIKAGAIVDYLSIHQLEEEIDPTFMKQKWGIRNAMSCIRYLPKTKIGKIAFYLKRLVLFPKIPLTFSSFTNNNIFIEVQGIIAKESYDYILIDGLHLGALFYNNGKFQFPKNTKVVYRAHNIESDLWLQSAQRAKSSLVKAFFNFQYHLMQKMESAIIANAHCISPISIEDDLEIQKINGKTRRLVSPLGFNFKELSVIDNKEHNLDLLFLGRLDWPPNRDGLKWFLDDIWPKVIKDRSDITLNIVGSGDASWLEDYQYLNQVKIHGRVELLSDIYKMADFTIVPIQYGSGTRIKVVESFSFNTPLISTTMGVQGAELSDNDYIAANSEKEWVSVLSSLTISDELVSKFKIAHQKISKRFDEVQIGQKFYSWLKQEL
jgi:glycosyltransferase involved in cell wall biosynthesis